jgi:cell division protein FtsW
MNGIKKYFEGDTVVWIITVLLLVLSIPAVYSASAMISQKAGGGDIRFLIKQLFAVILALITVYAAYRIPFKTYMKVSKILLPIALILLLITNISGVSHNDARRWIEIPVVGIELQTSEIAKIALIMFLAKLLTITKDNELYDKNVRTATIAAFVTIAMVLPSGLSNALIITFVAVLIMFVAAVRLKSIYKILLIALGIVVLYLLFAEMFDLPGRISTWGHRLDVFFSPDDELLSDETYQSDISKMAIVNGGVWGQGPGNGTVRFLLPQSHSDFIFAFIIEEYGLWMALIIMMLYGALFYRGVRIAKKTDSLFAAYLVLGLTLAIVLQAFINMGVSVGALPVTGQTLPLISMGRTSLLVTSFSIGIILNISKHITPKEIPQEISTTNEPYEYVEN